MLFEEVASVGGRQAEGGGEGFGAHAVLHGEGAAFEAVAFFAVGVFGGVRRHGPGHACEGEVGVAGVVGLEHGGVSRERGGGGEFLLAVVDVGEGASGFGPDEMPHPCRRAEDEFRVGWLVASGLALKGAEYRPVSSIVADRQIEEFEAGDGGAQFAQGL